MLRKALPGEHKTLSDLAVRSKAYWGYDKDFMKAAISNLQITVEEIQKDIVIVYLEDNVIVGFYILANEPSAEMTALFVDPRWIGQGVGKKLWIHALENAKKMGWSDFKIVADLYAANQFYIPMGCTQVGESPVVKNRKIPILQFKLL
ncbi:MAG: GNAT family N-acetyltransferase [Bdellovibrionales bacterium]|nr:GNAT family N-acetyltransferase [Bdellovibrionales bacterium]NQZ18717.1 GNAT family N-acetyltransferase [Bdellovibrionales bacterium]